MTSRTSGHLIAHLSFRVGGAPFCKSKMACATVTSDDTLGYQICKRCQTRLEKMRALKSKRDDESNFADEESERFRKMHGGEGW